MADPPIATVKRLKSGRYRVMILGRHVSDHPSLRSAEKGAELWRNTLRDYRALGAAKRQGKLITDGDLDRMAERVRGISRIAVDGILYVGECHMRAVIGSYRTDGLPAGIGYRAKKGLE